MVQRLSDMMATGAYAAGRNPMVNLARGGQNGFSPVMQEILSSGTYVARHLNCIVIDMPRGFGLFPDPDPYYSAGKALFETVAKSYDGFNSGLEVDWSAEQAVGGAGELFQDYTNVTRTRTEPNFVFPERPGRPVGTFFDDWITYLIADANTKYPAIIGLNNTAEDWLPDWYTATMLFYETDPLYKYIMKAWLVTNMAPKTTGEVTGKRDLTQGMEAKTELTIGMTGVAAVGFGINAMTQQLLSAQQIGGVIYSNAKAFVSEVSQDIAKQGTGLVTNLDYLRNNSVARG